MSDASPAPMMRPPAPGGRAKTPRLGLAIPLAPGQKSVNPIQNGAAQPLQIPSRSGPPKLSLATPMGTSSTPQESTHATKRRGPPLQMPSASGGSSDESANSRANSFSQSQANGSVSTASSLSLDFTKILQNPAEPGSAASSAASQGMEREGSTQGIVADLAKLELEKGAPLDVEDLDDAGWTAAHKEGRIEELGSLGEGAGGAVNKCRLKGSKTVFALKVITSNPDPDIRRQIVRELNFNKSCASAHICKYFGAWIDSQTAVISIVMEFCEGGSLDSVYREVKKLGGRTGEKVLGKVADGVLNGLTYLHSARIIHRDIKPSNILLTRTGEVKLCDFGVSGEFGTRGVADTFIGTSYYMAPERITGQSYTITSDVWSLGVTLLEVAAHKFPFPADGEGMAPRAGLIDLLTYIVRQPTPTLKDEPENNIKWSDNFKYFVDCCLEKQGDRRATPWKMLEHPWMQEIRSKKVNMVQFLSMVWDWQ